MKKQKKKDARELSTRQLMGIDSITDYSIATRMGELVFFIIKPTNISVLPDSGVGARIYALLNVVKGMAEIEMLALNSKESFENNKAFYRRRVNEEELPIIRKLLEQDSSHLDRIQVLMASSREFYIDYNQTPPQRVPLSQQKEFKAVRNMVIRETLRLSEMSFTFEDDTMPDEPEPEEPPASSAQSSARTIYQQAHFYRKAKTVLNDADADPGEKAMALVTLRRLWEDGYTIAAHQLGKAYRDGLGSPIDRETAAEWFQKSAEAGNDCSAYALGKLLLEQGKFSQARSWLQKAAMQKNQYAQYRLSKLLLIGADDVSKDVDAAIRHLKDSAAQGNQFAQYTLGKLYLLGQEVKADHEEALRYLSQAAVQGNTYAQYFIDHQNDFNGVSVGTTVLRMLHQMSRIFRENAAQPAIYAGMLIDKKRRRRLQEKRMAMGHKADDHEDSGLTQPSQ